MSMSDPTPTPAPTPAAKTSPHGVINKKQEQSVALAEQVVTAAGKDEYSTVLETEHEITAEFIAQLGDDCETARGGLGQIVQNAVARSAATGGKTGAKNAIRNAIRNAIKNGAKNNATRIAARKPPTRIPLSPSLPR